MVFNVTFNYIVQLYGDGQFNLCRIFISEILRL